ncbi:unnamed protein product [Pylaiella littoralis]
MTCSTFTAPIADFFPTGRTLLPAFCSSAISFSALSRSQQKQQQQQQLRSTVAASTTSSSSLAVFSGGVRGTNRRRRGRSEVLRCGLTRLSGDAGHRVLPVLATRDQWSHYWGGSDVQRVGKLFEVTAVAFLGLWACYFASFFLGVATMTVIGTSFLFYWLLAPNVTSFRRNRALRGSIAPFPGAKGNSIAIFRARVASAKEEYHPVTGQPVFLRMVIEDEEGRALKFRTRTRPEYARIRQGMVAEAILVSPDERFDEILGVSDTFIPAANVWVGEYPYLDKVVMRRLLASRDLKRRQRMAAAAAAADGDLAAFEEDDDDDTDEELDPITYRDSWTQTRLQKEEEEPAQRGAGVPPARAGGDRDVFGSAANSMSDVGAYYREDEGEEPYFEGVGSSGFSAGVREEEFDGGGGGGSGGSVGGSAAGRSGQRQQWERVSGRPRPRRRPPASASRSFEAEVEGGGDFYELGGGGGGRVGGETNIGSVRKGVSGGSGMPRRYGAGEVRDASSITEGRKKGR